ncbi:hypothetical protein [Mesorhizobium sp.]|uniref:hypothetical protein n=1 Tax=Mesorhizobium sp. TaxID=1871066 RepID=UPI00257D69FC|nr:hypothetical protein [Mesorhizobium sp.]
MHAAKPRDAKSVAITDGALWLKVQSPLKGFRFSSMQNVILWRQTSPDAPCEHLLVPVE